MSGYKYVSQEDSDRIRAWAHLTRPRFFFEALPLINASFHTPITERGFGVRAEILGNVSLRTSIQSLLDSIMTGEVADAVLYWEEIEEDFYPFLDTLEVKYHFGVLNTIRDLVDLIFGSVLHLGFTPAVQVRYLNLLLEALYDTDDFTPEETLSALGEHQQDLVESMVNSFDMYLEVQRDLGAKNG